MQDVSLVVPQSRFTALLGLNGAGKTTLFSLITRLYDTRQGWIEVFGHCVSREPGEALRRLGVVFQARTLDLDISVMDNLLYHAALHGIGGREARRRAEAALRDIELADRARDPARKLSGGQMRRVEITRALLHEPRVLVLDEATVGLDVASKSLILRHVRSLVRERGVAVLWATHLLDEVRLMTGCGAASGPGGCSGRRRACGCCGGRRGYAQYVHRADRRQWRRPGMSATATTRQPTGFTAGQYLICLQGIVWREALRFVHQRGRFIAALYVHWSGCSFSPPVSGKFLVFRLFLHIRHTFCTVYVTPGLVAMVQLFNGMQSSLSMVYDREMGNMRMLLVSPFPRWFLLLGKLFASTMVSILQVFAYLRSPGYGGSRHRVGVIWRYFRHWCCPASCWVRSACCCRR